jgi:flavin-dependent dehydrogenase
MDKANFPRDKTCAGWITPAVIELLDLDVPDYRQHHVFQPVTGFRTGLMGGPVIDTRHDHAVSYGIRRCEFDHYLLRRSAARLRQGEALERLERQRDGWLVNNSLKSPLIIGAGGHFCPVARFLGAAPGRSELAVTAQESEFALDPSWQPPHPGEAGVPELYFCRDLKGYGWYMRKDGYLNIGLGREGEPGLARQVAAFCAFLQEAGRIPAGLRPRFQGHAYLLYQHTRRTLMADGVLLIGDAAGLAATQSGEGIRPAIESGLLAAATILQANGRTSRAALEPYRDRLYARFGPRPVRERTTWLPAAARNRLAGALLGSHWFVRNVLLERWFLRAHEPPLRI